jgi:hypothetical protein
MAYHAFKDDEGNESGSFEVFEIDERGYSGGRPFVLPHEPGEEAYGLAAPGWYWWACFPGCLPDGEPNGPFTTEQEAIDDAQGEG